ncbi:MAG: FGGY family carbohydrate kinase [Cyclobacteriaceae bacterium]|nr:FGGY family carbohydrate kinase [Cyclobacteriaceae bacterium]
MSGYYKLCLTSFDNFTMPAGQYLLGFDLGSSSVKVALVDAESGKLVSSAHSPDHEMEISSPQVGWAEQDPTVWWKHAVLASRKVLQSFNVDSASVQAIGISYQMHGLVAVDAANNVLRPSIIWCDNRAIQIGDEALAILGEHYCQEHLLNSPGNFTASKLRWVKENQPDLYKKIDKFMLPGDYIAMRLTGEVGTTLSGLSEGIFWDFKNQCVSKKLLDHYEIDEALIPEIVPTFGFQGKLSKEASEELGLPQGIEVCYRSGDQPNNAFSLNALNPGEVAAAAGTSGVIYGVADKPTADKYSRVNTFAHVNHTNDEQRLGILLCVNGTGIMNSWLRRNWSGGLEMTYENLNELASSVSIGSGGIRVLPFGNGAERMLCNLEVGASFHGINLNRHSAAHMSRAVQEGIVFSLGYGFEILHELGVNPSIIRAGSANMFLSVIFCEAFSNITNVRLELFNTDGSQGAARGAGVGKGIYSSMKKAFAGLNCIREFSPDKNKQEQYREAFADWKNILAHQLSKK